MQSVLRAMLTWWEFRPVVATDGAEAWRILQSADAPRLAIVDWLMPGMDGVELCRRARASERTKYTYLMLLTARDNSADIVAGLDAGADDYLTKPFNAHELRARLRAGNRIVELQEQLFKTQETLRKLETEDRLTGLLTRPAIVEAVERELVAGRSFGVLLAGVDQLAHINSSFGQYAGDGVLHQYGSRLRAVVPANGVIGRYNGPDFLVLLPGYDPPHANECAERIRAAAAADPFTFGAASFPVTCTVGVTASGHGDSAALLRDVEEALARAKREARERLAESILNRGAALTQSIALHSPTHNRAR